MDTPLHEIYNRFATTYEKNRGQFDLSEILNTFYKHIDMNSGHLLDLGCGAGEPLGRFFIDKGWSVTGVDFSEQMLELATKYVPEMKTIQSDIREVSFDNEQFTALTACYSLFHIPVSDHLPMFHNFNRWLKPGGKALFTYATEAYTGSKEFSGYKEFMNQQLFYSHKTVDDLLLDIQKAGLTTDSKDLHTIGGETFLWLTVSK